MAWACRLRLYRTQTPSRLTLQQRNEKPPTRLSRAGGMRSERW
ncbi:hypothetical protein RE6C_02593 [Rhodopirellula europaea 6C]|uniref:Uncharacterized protein n=1 Tax=Rhodopirellula europaea 6C TaxID=1263867 RepID=M2AVB9_9BACT|nr:hypothetical protein RE6C_02593 [Rhodopirellula europaea 6C]